MNCSTSAEVSIIIEEDKSTESSALWDSRRYDHQFNQLQNRSANCKVNNKSKTNMVCAPHCGGGPPSNVEFHRAAGLPPIPSRVSPRDVDDPHLKDSKSNKNTDNSDLNSLTGVTLDGDDDIADRVLQTLERKDALLAEQVLCLQHRDAESAELRRELCSLRDEKKLLLQQVRSLLTGVGAADDGAQCLSAVALLKRAETALRDERIAREADVKGLHARIAQLTAQLHTAHVDAAQRERSHTAAMSSLMERTASDAAAAVAERDRIVRELQGALSRERAGHEADVAALQSAAKEANRINHINHVNHARASSQEGLLRAGVEQCVRGTERLEQCLRDALSREKAALSAMDALQRDASVRAASSRAELLEQQRLTAEMQQFYRARLEAQQSGVEEQRERADMLERDAAVAQAARVALQSALERARQHAEEMTEIAEDMRGRAARAEAERREAQRDADEKIRRNEAALEALRARLEREREKEKENQKEKEKEKENQKERERPVAKSMLDGWRERAQALERKLRAAQDDRDAAEQRLKNTIAQLEQRHREAMRRLESALRKRLTVAESAAAAEVTAQAERLRSSAARVAAELMAFVQDVEAFAAARAESAAEPIAEKCPSDAEEEEEEEALRAACDDIARDCLGLAGGWEALRRRPAQAPRGAEREGLRDGLPAATRQRVRRILAAYVETLFGAAGEGKGKAHEEGKGTGILQRGVGSAGTGAAGEQPMRELLMECVRCAFGVDDGNDLDESLGEG